MEIQTSRQWLLTSPHEDGCGPLPALGQDFYLEPDSRVGSQLKGLLALFPEHLSDYVVGLEDGNHVHLYLEYSCPVSLLCATTVAPGWNVQIVQDIDADKESAREYCRKGGCWKQLRYEDAIPRTYLLEPFWRPWQQDVLDRLREQDDRQLLIVYDSCGNHGKTFLAMWHVVRRRAAMIPATMATANDIMRMAYACPSQCYFVDFPRATTKKVEKSLFSALECVKNGQMYDERYNFRQRFQDPPKICVFSNFLPDPRLLSSDRWEVMTLD